MDLFFGASGSKPPASAQQTVNIRVEERIVPRRTDKAGPARHSTSSTSRAVRSRQHSPDPPQHRKRTHTTARPGVHNRRLKEHGSDIRRERKAAPRKSIAEPSLFRRTVPTVEKTESMPGSPFAHRKDADPESRHMIHRRKQRKGADTSPPSPESSLGRCASVPVLAVVGDEVETPAEIDEGVVSSVAAVIQSETRYEQYFTWTGDPSKVPSHVTLHLPADGESEVFSLLMPKSYDRDAEPKDEYLPINDLISTVRVIGLYLVDSAEFRHTICEDAENGVIRRLERARNRRRGDDFVQAVAVFNKLLDCERCGGHAMQCFSDDQIPSDLAIHIVEQIYNRIVAPTVDLLRQYKAFSNNVYGEILPILINEFIEKTQITKDSIFIDLGCGIGNVVLQVAAQTGCHASGIEVMKIPARFAKRQAREFVHRMGQFKLKHGPVQVWRGDFCESRDVQQLLPKADVLLVNNYAFDSKLNQNLLQLFLDLKEGSKIISLRPFVTPDHKINARTVYSTESILTVKRYQYWSQSVSWTDNGGEYFIQTVDRSRVKQFLTNM